ncbi:hypothetical protein EDB81DRAFT_920660 [Dactylonectria macrodidyma]|uniref:Antifreeze protein n=1 Tax=Dactylonectria macrodidyma TaxID=307937 RepID=A0A9P9IAW6_9HYPO|nr:hypothetical protein EDB81DRAFT_920660 [Dactylonectria macrodidyma]
MKNLALVTSFFFMTLAVALPGGVKPPTCPPASTVTITKQGTVTVPVTSYVTKDTTVTVPVTSYVTKDKTVTVPVTSYVTKDKTVTVPVTSYVTKDKTVTVPVTSYVTKDETITVPVTSYVTITQEESATVTVTKPCRTRTEAPRPTETCPRPHNWNKGLGNNSECSDSCSHSETRKNGETITCEPAGPGCKKHCIKCKKHPKCDGVSDGDACDQGGYCRSGECVWLVNKNQCGE